MSRLGRMIRSHFTMAWVAMAAAVPAGFTHAQVQQVPAVGGPRVQLPSGAIHYNGAPVIVREQFLHNDEGGIAGAPQPTGRCCLANGDCQIVTNAQCTALNGVYMGDNSTCAEFDCAQLGRCCINNNFAVSCAFVNINTCFIGLSGAYWQPGVTCEQSPCPPFGACCVPDGGGGHLCVITAEFLCQAFNGAWQGDNVDCNNVNCETPGNTGMCCIDGKCSQMTFADCDNQGGTYYGDGVACDDLYFCGDDPEAGACCLPDGSCTYTIESLCNDQKGTFFGIGELCEDHDCGSGPGACCIDNGVHCQIVNNQAECDALGGTWAGSNTECTSGQGGTCPFYVGKCCLQNSSGASYCLTLNIDQCFSNPEAVWWATPGECEDPGGPHCPVFGACCKPDGSCQVIDQNLCETFFNGVYKGDGTTCADTDGNGQAEVCEVPGDTNGDGNVNVSDLLGVITHWGPCAAPCPWDMTPYPNGEGMVNVQDLLWVITHWG